MREQRYKSLGRIKTSLMVVAIAAICLALAACPNQDAVKSASAAVNKYANALSAFQDAEIKLHDAGKVRDAQHKEILDAELYASKAGRSLDAAIAVAAKGNDPKAYIDVAEKAANDLIRAVGSDANTYEHLQLTITGVSDALQNAIS